MTRLPFNAIADRCSQMKIPVSLAQNDGRAFPLRFVNEAFSTLTGYSPADVLGKSCRLLQGPETDRAIPRHIRNRLEAGLGVCSIITNYRKSGERFQNFLIIEHSASDDLGPLLIGFQYALNAHTQKADLTEHIQRVADVENAVGRRKDLAEDQLLTALSQRTDTALLALKMLKSKGALPD